MPPKSTKSPTIGNLSNENSRSLLGSSKLTPPFGNYTSTTRKTTEMQYNLTQRPTTRPKSISIIQNGINDELILDIKKQTVRNLITNDYHASRFMTISLMGRLGNNMFQLAALFSCAKQLNFTVSVPANELINSYFLVSSSSNIKVTNWRTFHEKMYAKYDNDIEHIDTTINWTLSGFFQSWKYFYKDEILIRRSFEFRPNIYEPARQFVESFRLENKTIVGIHVRRGDMVTKTMEMSGYTTAPLSYLNNSMNYFREKYNDTFFIVVSDGMSWCKENIQGNNDTAFSNFTNPGTDMALLSVCDHVIITSGTFGWWGAWLAGGEVVYFKGFPKPGHCSTHIWPIPHTG
ncbi:hypothetical protein CHS0354_040521 [Potamilus streckersoni]|uniref:L-Fucosyltransferase n=1 Tax=Potamilus streckersoni TaxID=2493646 RepID=A0AAE0TK70_9BIVA|nr:hypothetical protein CHS0354_040521 [Potamilus streckersoni]